MKALAKTSYGAIEGKLSPDGRVAAFLGVPFAKPPIGALRWQPPQRPDKWDGVRICNASGAACPQPPGHPSSLVYGSERETNEDCLYLNVFSAALGADSRRPVIVWFHHGGFMSGWAGAPMYDGEALARAGVVLVATNYRLGRLGFLSHPALTAESRTHSSGNYGLLDQVAVLQWVQENIAVFGGDPDCVTIYGVSAGSFSVSAHMASPLSRGLFHRAIGSSGGSFGPVSSTCETGDCFQTLETAEQTCGAVMAAIGAHTIEDMRALSATDIVSARIPEFYHARRGLLDTAYPIIDGYVLPEPTYDCFARGTHNDVPLLTGSNTHELSVSPFNKDSETYVADARAFFGPFFDRFISLFPDGPDGLTMRSSMAATSERLFSWQNWMWARMQARHGKHAVYYYRFAHHPPVPANSYAEQERNPQVGAFHSAEIPYVFRNLDVRDWAWSETDHLLSESISTYWLEFARTGNPNGGGREVWKAFDETNQAMMAFDDAPTMTRLQPSDRFAFWDEFYSWCREGDRRGCAVKEE